MLETEFLFFQGMKKRTDEGALEGAVKCMMEK